MADDDSDLDSHKHRRKKPTGAPEWSKTCIGIWTNKSPGHSGKNKDEQIICRGISIMHLNKYVKSKEVKNIPTQGIEIIIREGVDDASPPRNLHPFLGIFVDEQKKVKKEKNIERSPQENAEGDKLKEGHSDEATPKIIQLVAENWGKRCHNAGEKIKKYYQDPSSSTEIIKGVKNGASKSYNNTLRILSYCKPQEKAKQVSNFISERVRSISKWWWK